MLKLLTVCTLCEVLLSIMLVLNPRQFDANTDSTKEAEESSLEGFDVVAHLDRLRELALLLEQFNLKLPILHLEEWNRLFKRHVLNLFKAKIVESTHPYTEYSRKDLTISIPKAIYLKIEFDPSCSTENEYTFFCVVFFISKFFPSFLKIFSLTLFCVYF